MVVNWPQERERERERESFRYSTYSSSNIIIVNSLHNYYTNNHPGIFMEPNTDTNRADQLNDTQESGVMISHCRECGAPGRKACLRPNGTRTCADCHPRGEVYLANGGRPLYLAPNGSVTLTSPEPAEVLTDTCTCPFYGNWTCAYCEAEDEVRINTPTINFHTDGLGLTIDGLENRLESIEHFLLSWRTVYQYLGEGGVCVDAMIETVLGIMEVD